MKTITVRIVVPDDADGEVIAEALLSVKLPLSGPIAGAVELVNDGFGHLVPAPQVFARPNFSWSGNPLGETAYEARPRAARRSRRREDYPFLDG